MDTIRVHHAGYGEARGNHPRVKIWCDISKPSTALMRLFRQVAESIEGIVDAKRCDANDANVELIIEPRVHTDRTATAWIAAVNTSLAEADEQTMASYLEKEDVADALAVNSESPTFGHDK